MDIPPIEKWEIVYEDPEIGIKLDPTEEKGYVLHIRSVDRYFSLPRGVLEDVARVDRDKARLILQNIIPYSFNSRALFENTNLNFDSFISAITKAYILEEERFEKFRREQDL